MIRENSSNLINTVSVVHPFYYKTVIHNKNILITEKLLF